ncbi:class I glutamine amidotransferase-like protein [Cladochytrium replicatum]|nr:class I glutamine amidotransferase-like protein [Cladochytrium replicatum]
MAVVRVAVLLCDTPAPPVVEKYGAYDRIFKEMLDAASKTIEQRTPQLEVSYFDVVSEVLPKSAGDFDAYIMTGSKYSAYEDLEWIRKLKAFVKDVIVNTNAKVVGICFGHQIIAEALGGKVEKNVRGWEVATTPMQLNEDGERFWKLGKSEAYIQQMHQDIVTKIPYGFRVLASSSICEYQSMILDGRVITLQGHPEFVPGVVKTIVGIRNKLGIFSDEFAADATTRADHTVDHPVLATRLVEFILS